jgi:hypothetical protein
MVYSNPKIHFKYRKYIYIPDMNEKYFSAQGYVYAAVPVKRLAAGVSNPEGD